MVSYRVSTKTEYAVRLTMLVGFASLLQWIVLNYVAIVVQRAVCGMHGVRLPNQNNIVNCQFKPKQEKPEQFHECPFKRVKTTAPEYKQLQSTSPDMVIVTARDPYPLNYNKKTNSLHYAFKLQSYSQQGGSKE